MHRSGLAFPQFPTFECDPAAEFLSVNTHFIAYDLQNGYIHNWLVAGPQAIPVEDLHRFQGPHFRFQIAHHYYEEGSGIARVPVGNDTLTVGDGTQRWRYYRCLDDHLVDLSAFYHTCHYLRSWAHVRLKCPSAQEVTFVLTSNGPADVWLNGQHVHRQEHFSHQLPKSVPFSVTLREGRTQVMIRFEEVAVRECPYVMRLQIIGPATGKKSILVPVRTKAVSRWLAVEHTIEQAYLDRDVYSGEDEIAVHWPTSLGLACEVTARVQTPSGRIYAEVHPTVEASNTIDIISATQLPDGPYQIMLMPPPLEYYENNVRVQRRINLRVLQNRYSRDPYRSYEERCQEALDDAARREGGLFSEIAKMELGRWSRVNVAVIGEAVNGVKQRLHGSDLSMVGLLEMMYRYLHDPSFPGQLVRPLEECVLSFRYWLDEPGDDAMCYWSEGHQIVFHTCEILAGQLFPDRVFTNAGKTGRWHREKGEQRVLSWLDKRGSSGWREWDSNWYFEQDVMALVDLADLAETLEVQELAAVVLDKLLFTIALNSYRGTFGCTHGRTCAPLIKNARLEATAGITRLMWGMGVFNDRMLGTVSLACAKGYELPSIIADIAADLPDEMWSKERHAGELSEWCDRSGGAWEVNKVTYKTPDYMLSSAQDYHPGERGAQEHIWQATMGPDAVVFVTHPPCVSEDGSHWPNFWNGNHVLPRVAQWRDVLIAIHRLAEDDPMGFTHAYFPIYAFDEYALRDGWAIARKGEGYLALTAAQGLTLVTRGPSAYRELRSVGLQNVWFCQMGRAAKDGSFADFQRHVLALDMVFDGLSLRCRTLRGESLAFAWEGPLWVDGSQQAITGFKHYENPYCTADLPTSQMEIRFRDWLLRLNLAR